MSETKKTYLYVNTAPAPNNKGDGTVFWTVLIGLTPDLLSAKGVSEAQAKTLKVKMTVFPDKLELMANAFAKAKAEGKGPRRNVLFMTVSGEEKGLWGSEYYSEHPTVPMDKVTADLNIDMIGRTDTERTSGDTLNYVYVVGDDKLSTELKPISEGVNKKHTKLVLDYKFNDPKDPNRIYYRSDHYNFARKGVPIIFYYDGMLKADYHQPTDTPDKINYPLLAKRAQLVFHTAWEMANRDAQLKRDIPLQ